MRNHDESHSTPASGSNAPKENPGKEEAAEPGGLPPSGLLSVHQQLLPLTIMAAPAPQMDVFAVPADRQKGWYLSLMAPNTKGPQFAWLDPSRLYCNSQVGDRRRTRLLLVESTVVFILPVRFGSRPWQTV